MAARAKRALRARAGPVPKGVTVPVTARPTFRGRGAHFLGQAFFGRQAFFFGGVDIFS